MNNLPIEIISINEFKNLKSIKFYNKNNIIYYKDSNDYFYFVYKSDIPNKKDKEEYEQFKNNNEAVYIDYRLVDYRPNLKWFNNIEEFNIFFNELVKNKKSYEQTPTYTIKKTGYIKKHPNNRNIIFRLPYFNINEEIKKEKSINFNVNSISYIIAKKWCILLDDYEQFGDIWDNIDLLKDIIEKWIEYNE